ncbi:MAG: hypothetical protein JWP12_2587 [Bacteroidetes bacterium]|nr:hypothetical protein [Bacteroidota bacterium]
MKTFRLKYLIFLNLLLVAFRASAQPDNNTNNDATVTIVGNIPDNNDNNLPGNYSTQTTNDQPPPPAQQQLAPKNDNIEPTIENGFHMRYQIQSPGSAERMVSVGSSSAGGSSVSSGAKSKRHAVSLAERSFNFKKKFKNWCPHRKKKYHPTLCEKFK